ncbi:hypothetical protein BKA67DRAFT_548242 [Truncatella angustata]|uniref:Uncharacterized protein n=1 Tax=Truncatella angustata TaxID=152316 RepID=A0A9P8UY40_9PEZI|nr:uncharacterized protein BKA67DRAFT_548242 [Truncatella angustata]KAH6660505.1 hypothetical protein BKA67DRAFT_548242 [Truncatella angustata]
MLETRFTPIKWESTKSKSIPRLRNSMTFHQHLALCVIPKYSWQSKGPLIKKFECGLFWDKCKDLTKESRTSPWAPNRIRQISAIQKLQTVKPRMSISSMNTAMVSLASISCLE